MKQKVKTMAALLDTKDTAVIEVQTVIGLCAIHPRIQAGRASGEGWTVSHLPSGMAVWTVATEEEAIKVAEYLTEHRILPEGRGGSALAWRDSMTVLEREQLIARLSAIAPRYTTPWRTTTI